MSAAEAVQLSAEEAALARELSAAELAAAPPGSLPFEAWYMDDSQEDQRLPHRCGAVQQRCAWAVGSGVGTQLLHAWLVAHPSAGVQQARWWQTP